MVGLGPRLPPKGEKEGAAERPNSSPALCEQGKEGGMENRGQAATLEKVPNVAVLTSTIHDFRLGAIMSSNLAKWTLGILLLGAAGEADAQTVIPSDRNFPWNPGMTSKGGASGA